MSRAPNPIICGVYLLFRERKLIYVGRSKDIYRRVNDHRAAGREFDYVAIIGLPEVDADWIERGLIKALVPKQNRKSGRPADELMAQPPSPAPSDVLSMPAARKHVAAVFPRLREPLRRAVRDGSFRSVVQPHGKLNWRLVRRTDVDAWIEQYLTSIGLRDGAEAIAAE
jgi:GIY-YIG catalytic domain